jgi:heme exporter protein A
VSAFTAILNQAPAAAAATAAHVEVQGLGKTIDERTVLHDITFAITPGRYVALLGANGAGKSTLLKILATLTPPTGGKLHLFGENATRNLNAVRARIGLIGHQSMLYHDLSARENLEFFGRLYGVKNVTHRAMELLETLGLAQRAEDCVKTFSRGMTQRVSIARALMHNPDLLLADEPFAGLDAPSVAAVEEVLSTLHRAGKTIILANHDIAQSLHLAQHAIVLRRGRKVISAATCNLEAADVLGEMQA